MNERIQKIAEQAGFYVSNGQIYIPTTSEDVTEIQQRFVELLVGECGTVAYNTYCQTPSALGIQYKQAIEKHFEV